MAKKNSIRYRSRSEWQAIIAGQEASGQTALSYCRENGISEKSFYNWRRKMRQATVKPEPGDFIQIRSDQEYPAGRLTLHMPGGYRLEVPQGTDGAYVNVIVKALRS